MIEHISNKGFFIFHLQVMHFAYLNLILQLKNEQLLFYFYFKLQISKIEVYN